MLTEERQRDIARLVMIERAVTVQQLSERYSISESTARRDLLTLQKMGLVNRVHGGATVVDEVDEYNVNSESIQQKYAYHVEEKRKIAAYAATLIEEQDFIYIDGGSTTEQMGDFLTSNDISIVTNSLPLAQKLAARGLQVSILPGTVKGSTESVIGGDMRDMLRRYHFTKGFFGTNGIDLRFGCTTPDQEEAACKTAALKQCTKAYVLADTSKFGRSSHVTFATLAEVVIITAGKKDLDVSVYGEQTEVCML